ncbi:MAG TPA: hypothetical protein VE222_04435, partial [Nitrospiraceae bacterium]|nr:hypothetical protein [Nitrospiraceae bacterium]
PYYSLYRGTHDELMECLRFLFEKAAERATDLLIKEQPSTDSMAAISLANSRKYGIAARFMLADPFVDLPMDAWRRIDLQLAKAGALKFPVQAKTESPRDS